MFKWDVADAEACKAGIAKVEAELGPVEILVNNAGITRDAAFHRMTLEQWQQVMSTNVDSLFTMTRPVWEGMRARKFGRVISISSVNGQKGQFGQTNYAAAKAAAIGFTKALAQEGAALGITVNCVCPGYIGTEMVKAVPEEVLKAKILPQIPVGRLGEPEEIARCVAFLASDDAGFITGSTLSRQRRPVHGLTGQAAGRSRRRSPNSRARRCAGAPRTGSASAEVSTRHGAPAATVASRRQRRRSSCSRPEACTATAKRPPPRCAAKSSARTERVSSWPRAASARLPAA